MKQISVLSTIENFQTFSNQLYIDHFIELIAFIGEYITIFEIM